jgi:uncharacterized DUF497 family protein
MDFEWDVAKEQANRKKHRIGFRTAAKVFLDPHVIEFDDRDAEDELRFNAIGMVDGRMLFVTYTMRGSIVRIISARGAERHEKRKYHELEAQPQEAAEDRLAGFRCNERRGAPSGITLGSGLSAGDQVTACPRATRPFCPCSAEEAEDDAGGVRNAVPFAAWHRSRLGTRCTSP